MQKQKQQPAVVIVILAPELAQAFARFVQQVSEDDYERHARDIAEASRMFVAGEVVRDALARAGFGPSR